MVDDVARSALLESVMADARAAALWSPSGASEFRRGENFVAGGLLGALLMALQ